MVGAVPRRHGPRARARHHHQGPRRPARLPGRGRPGLRPQPDRHARPRRLHLRGVAQPGRVRGRDPGRRRRRRASRRRRSPTSTWRSTTTSRSSRSSTRSTCRAPSPRRVRQRDRGRDRPRRLARDPRPAPRRGPASTRCSKAIVRDIPPPKGDPDAPPKALHLRLLVRSVPRRGRPGPRLRRRRCAKGQRIRMMATGKEFEVTRVGVLSPRRGRGRRRSGRARSAS